jgi:methyl-accepting chemotaxis protein WspA
LDILNRSIDELQDTAINKQERLTVATIKKARGRYADATLSILSAEPVGVNNKLELIRTELEPAYLVIRAAIDAAVQLKQTSGEIAGTSIHRAVTDTQAGILAGILASLILVLVSGYLLARAIDQPLARLIEAMDCMRQGDFTRRVALQRRDEFGRLAEGLNRMSDDLTALVSQVQNAGTQVNGSVNSIASTSKQQETTAGEIASTATQIGATSNQITATSKELVKTMTEVSGVADQTAQLAGDGQSGLAAMNETIRNLMQAADAIGAKLAVLNEKAGNINQVVTTITKVADQTNLLSLNAAIEAEKAGEYGRGFAVVATEIRRLADQTAVATYDIEQMVSEMQSAVTAGVMGMDQFSDEVRRGEAEVGKVSSQLTEIIRQVQALTPRFNTVTNGMENQSAGAQHISKGLAQLSEAVQQTAKSLRDSSGSIEHLNEASLQLQAGVRRFRLHSF